MKKTTKIRKVYLDDSSTDETIDVSLDIHLDNGQIIIFSISEQWILDILEGNQHQQPQTDGDRIYWENGSSMTLDDIISALRNNGISRRQRYKKWIAVGATLVAAIAIALTIWLLPDAGVKINEPDIPLGECPICVLCPEHNPSE